jgi:hypothetical protein
LFDRQKQPEGCWDWFEILATTTLSGREQALVLALLDDAGAPRAAIPVVTLEGQVIRGLTSPFTTLFSIPLGSEEDARTLGRLFAAKIGATFRLDALDGADPASQAFAKGLQAGGLAVTRFRHFANWFERIDDFSRYWEERESQLKSTVKRKAASLTREGRLALDFFDLTAGWREGAEIYQGIYARSWKPAEPHPHFMEALLEKLGARGIARLAIARVDDRPAAAQIWLVQEQRATIFKLAHDPAFDRQSIGTLLTHWTLRQLHDKDGVRDVDFGRGNDPYKRQWLGARRDRQGLLAANPRSFKGLVTIFRDILPSRLVSILRRGPAGDISVTSLASPAFIRPMTLENNHA